MAKQTNQTKYHQYAKTTTSITYAPHALLYGECDDSTDSN